MTRRSDESNDCHYFRRSSRSGGGGAAAQGRCITLGVPYSTRPAPRIPTTQEFQATMSDPSRDGSSNSARRRIQVACGRCRKRKIRCTGDPGDGSGCLNCRNAGADAKSNCKFLRVQSHLVEALTSPSYPYQNASHTSISMPHLGSMNTLGSYPLSLHNNTFPPNESLNHYARMPNDFGVPSNFSHAASRPAFNGYIQYGDSPPDPYDVYSPGYPIPSSQIIETGPESLRSWGQLNSNKSSGNGLFVEQDSPQGNETSSLPLLTSPMSRIPPFAGNSNILFNQIAPPSSSLAMPLVNGRTLPQPTGSSQHRSSIASTRQPPQEDKASINGFVSGTNSLQDGHSAPENEEQNASTSSRKPSNSSTTGQSTASIEGPSAKKSSSISSESSIPYIAIAHSPLSTTRNESSQYLSANASTSSLVPSKCTPVSSMFPPLAPEVSAQNNRSFSSPYCYTSDSNYKRGSMNESTELNEGTLSSGQPYTRLHETLSQHKSSTKSSSRESDEIRRQSAFQNSIGNFRG